jgi:ketosteroid isomerase-like protein
MKQLLFTLAGLVLLISCNNTKDGTNGGDHTAVADRNSENTKKVYKAIETGDVSALDTLFAEDVIDHNATPDGRDIVGRDSVKVMIGSIHNYFEGLKMEMLHHATSADGQYHYSTVRMTGKSKANPWGMPVGMDMDDTSIDVVKLKDGKAAEHWGFMSMGDFNEIMKSMSGQQKPSTPADTTKTR